MRSSTVYVTKEDKEELVKHINAINEILNKYPYSNDHSDHFVTTMSRAKTLSRDALKWIGYLDVK